MTTLRITHDRESGTLITGSRQGDGAYEILRANGWRYNRHIGICIQHSRDRADHAKVDRSATALREAGFDVAIDIDDTARPTPT